MIWGIPLHPTTQLLLILPIHPLRPNPHQMQVVGTAAAEDIAWADARWSMAAGVDRFKLCPSEQQQEYLRSIDCRVLSQTYWVRTSGHGARPPQFYKPPQWFWCLLMCEDCWSMHFFLCTTGGEVGHTVGPFLPISPPTLHSPDPWMQELAPQTQREKLTFFPLSRLSMRMSLDNSSVSGRETDPGVRTPGLKSLLCPLNFLGVPTGAFFSSLGLSLHTCKMRVLNCTPRSRSLPALTLGRY